VTLTWVGGTNFDQAKSTPELGYSFLGDDPHDALVTRINLLTAPPQHQAANESAMLAAQLQAHLADITSTFSTGAPFQLNLGQKTDLTKPTNELFETYKVDVGNPYLEMLAFEFGRYLLWASARGVLPSNLQGIWARDGFNP
jgi:alpha-L-fucosidase 2